jgi:hypothetical protein
VAWEGGVWGEVGRWEGMEGGQKWSRMFDWKEIDMIHTHCAFDHALRLCAPEELIVVRKAVNPLASVVRRDAPSAQRASGRLRVEVSGNKKVRKRGGERRITGERGERSKSDRREMSDECVLMERATKSKKK